jgi:hypothetical protein
MTLGPASNTDVLSRDGVGQTKRGSLRPPNRDALADTLQVFQGNPATGSFGRSHEQLADRVVDATPEAVFFAPSPLEQSLGRSGALGLQPLAEPTLTLTMTMAYTARGRRCRPPSRRRR